MKWIHYTPAGAAKPCYGVLEGEVIRQVHGGLFDDCEFTGVTHQLGDVRIEVPLLPRTFYAAGLNYVAHIQEYAEKTGAKIAIPDKADIGYRAVNALVAHDEAVVIPEGARQVEYEGELVVVIGKKARHLSREEALSCVFGYTLGNDVSERLWQAADRTFWRAKNSDTFKPMGPWIDTAFDIASAVTTVSLNGQVSTQFKTADMLFGIAEFISVMTRNLTLYPGDVIWMGTDGKSPALKPGDVVEVEISGLGRLRNHFVAAVG